MADATATPAPARLSLSPVGPGRRASHWERARAGCLTFANAALTPRTRLLGLARRAPQPGNHRQSRWPLRKLADRRQGCALASVRKPEPGAARPGNATAEVVGHLASLAKPSRRQPRPAAGSLTGPLMAGQCLTICPASATLPSVSCLTIWQGRFGHARPPDSAVRVSPLPCASLRRLHGLEH